MLDVSTQGGIRALGARDLPSIHAVLDRDPLVNVFVEAHLRDAGASLRGLNARLWGYFDGGRLTAVCYAGANLVPASATEAAAYAFGMQARRLGRNCSSLWGRREVVEPMWRLLAPRWGRARAIRDRQPFLVLARDPIVPPDPSVRRATEADLDAVYRASVAFFTEELGVSPERRGGGAQYRQRVRELVSRGRAFVRMENGEVTFKAEIGVASPHAFQIQGVWVHPARRGQGLSSGGVAAVVAAGRQDVAPVATLYVNDFNVVARRTYARVGFTPMATFMTVLF
ncbi:MAG TPA: GNAT family N-acetyltransferase [Actinopolymorphaceae bacterium]